MCYARSEGGMAPLPYIAAGYYIGTSWDHYRNHRVYVKDTISVRTEATVLFVHKYLAMPTVVTSDTLIKAVEDMSCAVKGVFPTSKPTQKAFIQLIEILKDKACTRT